MARPLTEVIGEPSPIGAGWLTPPKRAPQIAAAVEHWDSSGRLFTLRVRPGLLDGSLKMPSELTSMCRGLLDQIATREDRRVSVTVARKCVKGPYEKWGRQFNEPMDYPVDRPFQVSVKGALLLLNRQPYSLIFEEVDDGTGAVVEPILEGGAPPSPGAASRMAALEQQLRLKIDRLAELEAKLEAKLSAAPDLDVEPEPKKRKRSRNTPPVPGE